MRIPSVRLLFLVIAWVSPALASVAAIENPPDVILITVDTLRSDRLSAYGYEKETTPRIDRLMADGVRFTQARTVEPLTTPSLYSILTSLHPHEHGSTRNGMRPREGLISLPRILGRHGYMTAAFVGNWTLKDKLSGLSEHFDAYNEVFTRKRWFGLFKSEATGEDISDEALSWVEGFDEKRTYRPFFLWVHYVEPHAPYRLQEEFAGRLGLTPGEGLPRADRYDTEVAMVDHQIGRLLNGLSGRVSLRDTLIIFTADHGESLGEHGYWGHGRHLFDPSLRIPMSITWPARIASRRIDAPALNMDVAPTVLSLLGMESPEQLGGFDWSPVIQGRAAEPHDRVTHHQAHKGAVVRASKADKARRRGLLEVARIQNGHKEIFSLVEQRWRFFDLVANPGESLDLDLRLAAGELLREWLRLVEEGLTLSDEQLPVIALDDESVEHLRSLGYAE